MWRNVFAVVLAALGCSSPSHGTDEAPPGTDPEPAAADPVAMLGALPSSCSVDHWCWRRPTPRGVRLDAAFATAPDNLWLAGEAGYVLSWNGATWREHVLPPPPFSSAMNLGAITGTGPDDIWVAGGDVVYHWDGAVWTLRASVAPSVDQELHGIWEAPNGDVWLTMEYGVVERSIGGGPFQQIDVPPAQAPLSALGSVWGSAPDDVWISGRPGRMFHWDGKAFTEAPTGTLKAGGNLWGSGKRDAWIGGYDGTLVHWNGTAWAPVDTGLGAGWYIKGIAATQGDPHDVWWIAQKSSREAATLHWDGTSLVKAPLPTDVMVDGLAIVDGRWWIPGDHGAVYVRPTPDAPLGLAIAPEAGSFRAMWGTSDHDMHFGGPGVLAHWDGASWTKPDLAIGNVQSICGAPGGEVWAVGTSAGPGGTLAGNVYHFAAGSWSKALDAPLGQSGQPAALSGVWAPGPGEAIAVGAGGEVYRHAGGAWTAIPSPVAADLTAVWGPDPDHAWIVGAQGTILRWERSSPDVLTRETSPIAGDLTAIHGAGGTTWIASNELGSDGMVGVLQSSSAGWVRVAVPHLLSADAIFASGANDIRIAGANNAGRVFHGDGATFTEEATLSVGSFASVFQPPGGSVWLAGDNAILQHTP